MERNKVKFEDVNPNIWKIARNCLSYLHKMINWKRFPNVSNSCPTINSEHPQVIRVYWKAPNSPIVKINTDGSFTKDGAGVGGIYRNHLGKCLLYFYTLVMATNATDTELIVVYWAIILSIKAKWNKLWLEVDSAIIIHLLNHEEGAPRHHSYWLNKIRDLSSMVQIHFTFIYREGNQPANWLAQIGSHSNMTEVAANPPPTLHYLLQGDTLDVPHFRIAYIDT
ncbi:uncharacterized protein LOC110038845 [Phalaenopsis equestris]|uniref:uncharacterized protein LOC110038845 n=1 Tax=Phalaenopsis equestris TaxID=78828 RepID=UPI0009E54215|nr:uncharacterized protein LOC110038845 [Phalaenopsis equestris]